MCDLVLTKKLTHIQWEEHSLRSSLSILLIHQRLSKVLIAFIRAI
jgi:hypothetical protein